MFYDCPDTQNVVQYIREFNEGTEESLLITFICFLK